MLHELHLTARRLLNTAEACAVQSLCKARMPVLFPKPLAVLSHSPAPQVRLLVDASLVSSGGGTGGSLGIGMLSEPVISHSYRSCF